MTSMDAKLFETAEGQKLVLEIGPNVKPQAQLIPSFEGAKILTLDVDENFKPDIVADAGDLPPELFGKFDGVLASHVLEHFSYWRTIEVLKSWGSLLKPGGELHILVPSLEWAARQILSEQPSPATISHLYAGQTTPWDVHLNGFTMRKLRQLFEHIGLNVRIARTAPYPIRAADGNVYEAEQHYVVANNEITELRKA